MTTLKRKHSLVDGNVLGVVKRLKSFNGPIPTGGQLASVSASIPTSESAESDLKQNFKKITGESAEEILELTGREENMDNLRLLLHLAILEANEKGQPKGQQLVQVCTVYWLRYKVLIKPYLKLLVFRILNWKNMS